uniref:Uncharacterized protein n=1 Tax=Anguilla anguilla TaxID=7936 RepID=A0A0E9QQU5_ANGAN
MLCLVLWTTLLKSLLANKHFKLKTQFFGD